MYGCSNYFFVFRYNSLGQLVCAVCSTNVKNENLWNAHLLSRTHKDVRKTSSESNYCGSISLNKICHHIIF